MVLGWQALEAQKADKPLEQGRALEQVAARMKRVMGLTTFLPVRKGRRNGLLYHCLPSRGHTEVRNAKANQ